MSDLWSSIAFAIDPKRTEAMPAVLQSTINLLESELVKARAALRDIQPNASPFGFRGDDIAVGAMAAYRQDLIGRAPDFYGSRRLTLKELGLVPVVRELPERVVSKVQSIAPVPPHRTGLEDILSNSLILDHMAPYLSVSSLMTLSSTSRRLHTVITRTPYVFRHLDLSRCRGAELPTITQAENDSRTEDEIYSAPLKRIFTSLERRGILQDVRTLVLDGVSVPADLVADIILTDRFNVNILSIRECRHLNERKLMQVIQHAVRPTRPAGTPRVKGIYHFSPMHTGPRPVARPRYRDWWGTRVGTSRTPSETPSNSDREDGVSVKSSVEQQNEWYSASGKLFKHNPEEGWAQVLKKCEGVIAFDAALCRGPRHDPNLYSSATEEGTPAEVPLLGPAVATVALGPRGCDGCHSSPEGPAIWSQSPDIQFPMLSPPPLHSSSVAAAKRPELIPGEHPVLIARCTDCLTNCWCHRCNKWFCGNCLPNPQPVRVSLSPHQTAVHASAAELQERERLERGVSKDCWECGPTCASCKLECQHTCQGCQGDYCIQHNEGCSKTLCDWCNTSARGRMRGDFY
ncbi:hypothetical protein N7536_006794 [Penicillium majusculum]|uniref:F-box domain-containing protein n=1 Tax=Penicillium solitum TaxID=60172 RepID=A0A1V6QXX6_9EURO|nr:uncharacterized protein PENSOL_c028G10025 [Penicillium solitum]KAJ5696382.1 hypothetical protein N7536_006794 [Penicillium majusculum]OQD94021.1 hypothetical protein PENSOL_c028G10025 [Penicillium solitum]